jgi:hypothetical protein
MRSTSAAQAPLPADSSWHDAAGTLVYETTCELGGAFPGYIEQGARMEHAQVRLYERMLVVDEGRARGFALSFDRIIATDDGDQTDIDDAMIRVRYRDGEETRLFSLRPRASRLMLRGGRRAFRLLDELAALGVPGGSLDDIPGDTYITSWGETDAFGHETMVWHGHASAPLALRGERSGCDVFITSKSLVWGRDARSPIARVPIESVRDVTPGHGGTRDPHPMAFVGIGDSEYERVEFAFVFDAHDTEDRNALERSAFVVHLRSRQVALAYPEKPVQPWAVVPVELFEEMPKPLWPEHSVAVRQPNRLGQRIRDRIGGDEVEEPRKPAFNDPAERLRPDRGVITAEDWSTQGDTVSSWAVPAAAAFDVVESEAIEVEPMHSTDVVLSEWAPPESPFVERPAAQPRVAEPTPELAPVPEPAPVVELIVAPALEPVADAGDRAQAFEVEALAVLSDLLGVIRRREAGEADAVTDHRPPSGGTLAEALDAVTGRHERGEIDAETASAQRARLLNLDDVMRRLDVLLPLHANGAVTTAELSTRRDALCADLSAALFAGKH